MGRYTGKTCRLIFMLVLTASFFVAEIVSGYLGNSIALVSDSFSMLSDLIALCVGLYTGRVSKRSLRTPGASFGFVRSEVVGALCNAVFLAALYFTILVEALQRLARPEAISNAFLILVVGALGLAVNVVGLLVFQDWAACCPCLGRPRQPPPPQPSLDDGQLQAVPVSSALEGTSGWTRDLGARAEGQSSDAAGASRLPPLYPSPPRFLPSHFPLSFFLFPSFRLLTISSPHPFSLISPPALYYLFSFLLVHPFFLPFLS